MILPAAIADFFRMKNERDDQGLWSLFTEDAVVVDGGEGTKMQGADEIKKWIEKVISGLNLHTEVRDCADLLGERHAATTAHASVPARGRARVPRRGSSRDGTRSDRGHHRARRRGRRLRRTQTHQPSAASRLAWATPPRHWSPPGRPPSGSGTSFARILCGHSCCGTPAKRSAGADSFLRSSRRV